MIAVRDIAYVRYQAPDLAAMARFLGDFGMLPHTRTEHALFMRARDQGHPSHITEQGPGASLGFGLWAGSLNDLDTLSRDTGVPVTARDEPGGGWWVRLIDPSGLRVDVVHGLDSRLPHASDPPMRAPLPIDPGQARLNRPVRLAPGASQVRRLGHVALLVPSFAEASRFYRDVLGMKVSDGYTAGPNGADIAAFLHCGLGSTPVDHHTVAIVEVPGLATGRIDHCAFEVTDLDDLMIGHRHLHQQGWKHSWGVGRHVEGSQIFDYWRDPCGHKIEHWTDGDRVNDDYPGKRLSMDPKRLAQWAPPLSSEFFD